MLCQFRIIIKTIRGPTLHRSKFCLVKNHVFQVYIVSLFDKVKRFIVFSWACFKIMAIRFDNFSLHYQLQVDILKISSLCFMVLGNIQIQILWIFFWKIQELVIKYYWMQNLPNTLGINIVIVKALYSIFILQFFPN